MEAPGSEERPLDALAVGETLANFTSHESAISLRTVGKFTRYSVASLPTSPSTSPSSGDVPP